MNILIPTAASNYWSRNAHGVTTGASFKSMRIDGRRAKRSWKIWGVGRRLRLVLKILKTPLELLAYSDISFLSLEDEHIKIESENLRKFLCAIRFCILLLSLRSEILVHASSCP
jgi:hypothetical protein